MPIYEYLCPDCGNDFETIHKVSDPSPDCPKCGAGVKKKISLSAFHLKGGGWYSDAYSGKDNKSPGSTDSSGSASSSTSTPAASTGSSESSTSSDTKAAKPTPSAKPAPASSSTD